MTRQHKEILRDSVESLHHLDLNKMVAELSDLLDEHDKQNLLNATKPALQRVEILLTEVLPRRGPTAFESFVQGLEKVDPPMAQTFLQSAGMKGTCTVIIFAMALVIVPGGWGVLPYTGYVGMCHRIGYGFSRFLNRVSFLLLLALCSWCYP